MKIWQKTIAAVATFALLFNSLVAPLSVLAQTVDETPSPTPEATTQPTDTPTPTDTATPEATATPLDSPSPTPSPTASPSISAKVVTNKPDYSPSETVIISGSNFDSEKTYSLTVNSVDNPVTSKTVDITADGNGSFTYSYQLDGNYRPNYKVEVKDGEVVVATTTFTDAVTISVTVTPATGGSLIGSSTVGGTYTTLSGPTLQEESNQAISAGTIILNIPTGFEFDTSSIVTATILNRPGGDGTNLTLSSGTAIVTTSTIIITVTSPDQSGTTKSILYWSGIKVRPTAVNPLATSRNITSSGSATISGVNGSTNLGALNEIDDTRPTAAITYSVIPSSVKPGDTLSITAMFSEPMQDSPVPKIAISGANTVAATNMTKVSSTNYYFSYTVGAGDGTATVTLSEGRDLAGLTVISTPTSGASFTVDSIAPTCPAPTITKGTNPGAQYIIGSTIYYTTRLGAGSFTVNENASDTTDTPKVNFPNTVSLGGDVVSAPYQKTYNFSSSPESTYNGTATITCQDNVGNTATSTFTVNKDNDAPVVNNITLDKYFVKDGDTINITSNITETGSGVASCHAYWSTDTALGGDTDLGDLGTDCSGSVTIPAGTGTHYILIGSTLGLGDNVGLFQPTGIASAVVTMDNTAPSTTDDAGPGNGTFLTSKTVTLTPDDHGGSGVAGTKYCIVDSTDIPLVCTPNISGTSVVVSCPGVASCSKIIFYSSTDNAGNIEPIGTHSHYVNIINDLVAPTTTDNIDGLWHKTNVTVNLTCADNINGSGCATTYYTTDGSTPTTSSSSGNSFSLIAEGTYTVKYFSVDNAGNAETVKTAANQVKIDKTNPTASLTSPSGGSYLKGTVNLTAIADDLGGSDIAKVEFWHSTVQAIKIGTDTSAPYSFDWNTQDPTVGAGDGSHTLWVVAYDNAGNQIFSSSVAVTVDNTAPVLTSKTIFSGWYNSNQTSKFTYSDATSGIVSGTPVTCAINTEGSNQTCSVTPNVCDNAGNCNTTLVTSNGANIDKTAPVMTITGTLDGGGSYTFGNWANKNVNITINGNDGGGSGYATRLHCVDITNTCTPVINPGPISISTEGTSYIRFAGVDNAGNTSVVDSRTVKIDKTAPTVGAATITPSVANGGHLYIGNLSTISATVADANLDQGSCRYTLDGTASFSSPGTYNSGSGKCAFTGVDNSGATNIGIEVCDLAGSCVNGPLTTVTVDTTAPTVSSADSDGQTYNLATVSPHQIKVTFSEDISNVPAITVHSPVGNQVVNDCYDSDAKTFCFNYTIPSSDQETHTIEIGNAYDLAGNHLVADTNHTFFVDTIAPTITGDFYRQGVGDHYAKVGDIVRVDFTVSEPVSIDSMTIAGHDIGSYQPQGGNNFYIYYTMTSGDTEGALTYSLTAHDAAGNPTTVTGGGVTFDKTGPATPTASPAAGDFTLDQSVTLSSTDLGIGVDKIYYTTDGSMPDNSKTTYSGAITVDKDMTIKAIAYDKLGNASDILTAVYGIAPIISSETSTSVSETSATITWTTDDISTSRVVYDTVSHLDILTGSAPNYGYASSTIEDSTKVTAHSVTITGLSSGTTYYYRVISHGSPESVGNELSFATTAVTTNTTTTNNDSAGAGDGLGCAVHDCSIHPSTLLAQVLGTNTWPKLAYAGNGTATENNVLGTETTVNATPAATIIPAPTPQPEKTGVINWMLTHKKISLGVVLVLIVIVYLLSKKRKNEKN